MRKRILIGVVVVLLLSMLVSTALAQVINTGPGKTNIFMQNLGSGHAQVTINFYREETGILDWSYPIPSPIPPKGSRTVLYPNFQLPDNWAGAAEVASTEPMAAIVNMFWDGNNTAAAYSGLDTPATEAYLPNLLKRTGRQTRVTVQNTEASQATVSLKFYNRNGVLVGTKDETIAAKAEETYNLDNVTECDFSATAGAGSLHITSNTKIAALATLHYPDGSAAYSGVGSGDTIVWAPGIWRKQVAGAWNIYSAVVIQNLGASAANITVECLKKATQAEPNPPSHVFTDTIASKAAYGINTIAVGTMPPTKWQNMINYMGTNWNGTIKVTSTNQQPLAGVVMYFNLGAAPDLVAYEAVRNRDATTNALSMPAVYRKRLTQTPAYWQWSVTFVQNLDNTSGSINVKFYDTQGNQRGNLQGYSVALPANSSVALNLIYAPAGDPWNQVLTDLGQDFVGAMYITSTSGRHIIGNTIFYIQTKRQGLGYSGFPVQQ